MVLLYLIASFRVIHWTLYCKIWHQKARNITLWCAICFDIFNSLSMYHQCNRQRDGQTEGQNWDSNSMRLTTRAIMLRSLLKRWCDCSRQWGKLSALLELQRSYVHITHAPLTVCLFPTLKQVLETARYQAYNTIKSTYRTLSDKFFTQILSVRSFFMASSLECKETV